MDDKTLVDDRTAEPRPLLTRSCALNAYGELRAALRQQGGEVADFDAAYGRLVRAKDDLQQAVTDLKARRTLLNAFRAHEHAQLELALGGVDRMTITHGTPVGAQA